MKSLKNLIGYTLLAAALVSCGDDAPEAQAPAPNQSQQTEYAGCIIPAGTKFRTVIGNFSNGMLRLDLYINGAGVTQIVGELQISSLESLYRVPTPSNNTSHRNQQYKTCVSSEGFPAIIDGESAIQDIDFALKSPGNTVFLETTYAGSTWLSGNNILGKMTIELQGWPSIDVIMY